MASHPPSNPGLDRVVSHFFGLWRLRARILAPVVVFTVVVLASVAHSANIGPRPRMVLTALPLFLGLAALLPQRFVRPAVALSAVALFAATGLFMGGATVP